MSTTRIKEKLSSIVSSQLPEFIQNDYTTFVAFVEAYYRFLEQDQGAFEIIQNARAYSDIDSTTEAFIKYFLKNYASDIPLSALANKKLLVKRIKDLYESKGSELSFKLLFNILFNTNVFVNYPYEFVLRSSDGRWSQKLSLRVETISGDRGTLVDRILTYTFNGVTYETPIVDLKYLTENLTEVYINPDFSAPNYNLGDTVYVSVGSDIIFSGIIRPTTVGALVTTPGNGFRKGQVYNINYQNGIGTLLRISNVNSNTGITEVKIFEFGYNYPTNTSSFVAVLNPATNVSTIDAPFASATRGFISEGFILTSNVSSPNRYFLQDYVGGSYTLTEILSSFGSNSVGDINLTSSIDPNFAKITVSLGSLARYPGQFTTPNGFLSEPDVRLQDNALYQPFAYQTNTEKDISEFYDIVIKLVHPAGQNLFNNRLLETKLDVSNDIEISPSSNVFLEFLDVFDVRDQISVGYPKYANSNVFISETLSYSLSISQIDQTLQSDSIALSTNKVVDESSNTIDSLFLSVNKILTDTSNLLSLANVTVNKLLTENLQINDSLSVGYLLSQTLQDTLNTNSVIQLTSNLNISDTITLNDSVIAGILFNRNIDDTTNTLSEPFLSTSRDINSTTATQESVSALVQDYFLEVYTYDDYVGTLFSLN